MQRSTHLLTDPVLNLDAPQTLTQACVCVLVSVCSVCIE